MEFFKYAKKKIERFLKWLLEHNQLYKGLCIDPSIFDLYLHDGPLPGIEDRVIHDLDLDSRKVFEDETAGFAEHPAEYLKSCNNDAATVLLEKTGVSDPECMKLNGRALTASALRKLLPTRSEKPDLVIHHSSNAVPEYKNPDLVPGMFPTLFPLGTGGFEDPLRTISVSFQAHANSLLDVLDHVFRYHYSFISVVLNIIQ